MLVVVTCRQRCLSVDSGFNDNELSNQQFVNRIETRILLFYGEDDDDDDDSSCVALTVVRSIVSSLSTSVGRARQLHCGAHASAVRAVPKICFFVFENIWRKTF